MATQYRAFLVCATLRPNSTLQHDAPPVAIFWHDCMRWRSPLSMCGAGARLNVGRWAALQFTAFPNESFAQYRSLKRKADGEPIKQALQTKLEALLWIKLNSCTEKARKVGVLSTLD